MRRWIALAARLYPRTWRERYGEEFNALLDDATADWRQLRNVTGGALLMQLTNQMAHLKVAGALALAGALLAMASLYALPPRYVASAVLRVTTVVDGGQAASSDVLERERDDRVAGLWYEVTSRDNILRILRDPALNLYTAERERLPLEDIAEQARGDLQVLPAGAPDRNSEAFRVSFAYPDRRKAQAAVDELVSMTRERNDAINQESAAKWKEIWSASIPFRDRVELAEPAGIPTRLPVLLREVLGTGGGLVLGMLVWLFRRRFRLGWRMAACGLAGCAVAGALCLLISEQYTARGVLRMSAPFDPVQFSGAVAAPSLNEWVEKLRGEVLDDNKLGAMLRYTKFGLDEATIDSLDKNRGSVFGMRTLGLSSEAAGPAFEITFRYRDQTIARGVVNQLMALIQTRYELDLESMDTRGYEQVGFARTHGVGEQLETVVAPTLTGETATHYRVQLMAAGTVMGILFAIARWSGESARQMEGESLASS